MNQSIQHSTPDGAHRGTAQNNGHNPNGTHEAAPNNSNGHRTHGTQNGAASLGAKAVRPEKPDLLGVHFDGISDELKEIPQWVLWKLELVKDWQAKVAKGEKPWTKIPYQSNGRKADSTKPETWSDFGAVRAAYERTDFDGVGFVVTPDCGIAGGDIDNALLDDRQWKPVVGESQHLLDTYFEQSPSGRGVRFFARGPLPDGRRKHGDFEIYNSGRYLTVTGHRLDGSPGTIEERPDEIAAWHQRHVADKKKATPSETPKAELTPGDLALDDNTLLDKAINAKNGDNFAALWEGQTVKGASEDDAALCFSLAFWTRKDASRMEHLLRASGRVREKWDEKRGDSTWIKKEIENAIYHCTAVYDPTHPALRAPDPAKIAAAQLGGKQEAVRSDEQLVVTLGFPCTDTGNAERFVAQHSHRFMWSTALGWMMWDGARWTPDERGVVASWEKTTVRSIYREAQAETDERRPIVAKWAATSESSKARRAMMEAVQKDGPKGIPSDFDANPWLLNTLSGTLDLRTGELYPHSRDERHSKLVPVRFDATASCSLWIDTLLTIFEGDEKLVRFVQVALGYSLTGLTREQCFFILFGKGANGKSLVLSILRAMLGDYQTHAAPATLMAKRADAIPNDVAMLRGARLVTSIETSEGRKFDEALVKALTGDDPFSARFFRKDFFTFTPEFKIFLATNHKPQIAGTDDGIWRRIRLIPFNVRFWDADKGESGPAHLRADKSLKDKILQHELPGILSWALDGCLAWQRDGIPSPQSVQSATDAYRAESDVLAQFIEDCAVADARVSVSKGDFHKAFSNWAKNNDLPPCSSLSLTNRMQEKGFGDKRGTGGTRLWLGIALLSPDDKKTPEPNGRNKKAAF